MIFLACCHSSWITIYDIKEEVSWIIEGFTFISLKKTKKQNKPNQNHTCNMFALHRAHLWRSSLILFHFSITLLPENFTSFCKCYFTAVDGLDLRGGESGVSKDLQSCLFTDFRWGGISSLLLPQLNMDNSCLLPSAVQHTTLWKTHSSSVEVPGCLALQPQIFLPEAQLLLVFPQSQRWGRAVQEQLLIIQL